MCTNYVSPVLTWVSFCLVIVSDHSIDITVVDKSLSNTVFQIVSSRASFHRWKSYGLVKDVSGGWMHIRVHNFNLISIMRSQPTTDIMPSSLSNLFLSCGKRIRACGLSTLSDGHTSWEVLSSVQSADVSGRFDEAARFSRYTSTRCTKHHVIFFVKDYVFVRGLLWELLSLTQVTQVTWCFGNWWSHSVLLWRFLEHLSLLAPNLAKVDVFFPSLCLQL